eukprot:GHUV01054023.1.p1 GENE.GHUV01054023.1~~GHUV01054023.1.p1  ORF type:complete len:102 (-),score=18.16 GHUV01054023.1:134-439(-)
MQTQHDVLTAARLTLYHVAGIGHSLLSYSSTLRGISKVQLNQDKLHQDLDNSWEVLAEPIQTVMRRYGVPEPYEKLKAFTRGQRVTQDSMQVGCSTIVLRP